MNRWSVPAACLVYLLAGPFASAADFAACDPGGTQIEMTACAADDLAEADRQLNATYQALMKKEAANPAFIARLRTAQRAWVAFRDAELDAMYACNEGAAQVCWGSMASQCSSSYQARLTRERTKRLQQYLDEGQPADGCH